MLVFVYVTGKTLKHYRVGISTETLYITCSLLSQKKTLGKVHFHLLNIIKILAGYRKN